jgi:hypothetical protein
MTGKEREMTDVGDPLGHLKAVSETERRYPVESEEPPPSYRRKQLIVAALIIGVPVLAYVVWRLI